MQINANGAAMHCSAVPLKPNLNAWDYGCMPFLECKSVRTLVYKASLQQVSLGLYTRRGEGGGGDVASGNILYPCLVGLGTPGAIHIALTITRRMQHIVG